MKKLIFALLTFIFVAMLPDCLSAMNWHQREAVSQAFKVIISEDFPKIETDEDYRACVKTFIESFAQHFKNNDFSARIEKEQVVNAKKRALTAIYKILGDMVHDPKNPHFPVVDDINQIIESDLDKQSKQLTADLGCADFCEKLVHIILATQKIREICWKYLF